MQTNNNYPVFQAVLTFKMRSQINVCNTDKITPFLKAKNGDMLNYASINPFEAVACDMSKRIMNNLNKDTFISKNNFIQKSPNPCIEIFS